MYEHLWPSVGFQGQLDSGRVGVRHSACTLYSWRAGAIWAPPGSKNDCDLDWTVKLNFVVREVSIVYRKIYLALVILALVTFLYANKQYIGPIIKGLGDTAYETVLRGMEY